MSQVYPPPFSLPPQIAKLMTNLQVMWEQSLVSDINGQWSYAPKIQIACWMEGEGLGINAGMTNSRANFNQDILQQTRRPEIDLFFNGSDPRVKSFTMTDRFTPLTTAGEGIAMMPSTIETFYGPPFDSRSPWLICVGF